MIRSVTLLSAGRDPYTGTPCRHGPDARALTLWPHTHAVHVGDPEEAALREYLGMGLKQIEVLPARGVHVPALSQWLMARADVVICGPGMLPYQLAVHLDWPLLPDACSLEIEGGEAVVTSVTGATTRRSLAATLPVVVTVDQRAPDPAPVVAARWRAGEITTGPALPDGTLSQAQPRPHTPRPPAMPVVRGATAWERIRQIIEPSAQSGRLISPTTPEEAARELLEAIARTGVWRAPPNCNLRRKTDDD